MTAGFSDGGSTVPQRFPGPRAGLARRRRGWLWWASRWPLPLYRPNHRRYRPGFVARVLRFAVPAGPIIAAATFSAYALARANGLPLAEQRTAATLVALILSLCVLTLLAIPLTWRRIALLAAAAAAFVLLFPVPAVRHFYALALPHGTIGTTLLIAALGAAALTGFWALSRHHGRGPAEAATQ